MCDCASESSSKEFLLSQLKTIKAFADDGVTETEEGESETL
jgi:hypothetical protein